MALTAEQRIAGAKKSAEMRKLYAQQRKALNLARPKPEPPTEPEQSKSLLRRLSRICKQLDLVDTRIEEELAKTGIPGCDGQLVNWLCSAQERLAEQERILAGRPLPGSLKPTSKASKRQSIPSPDAPA